MILCHKCNNKKGQLAEEIPQPDFLYNSGHRIKAITKPMFALATTPKSVSTVQRYDAIWYSM